MTTYKIDKPEKGAGLIEYFLKYLTIFILVGFFIWAFFLFLVADDGFLTENFYMITLYFSFGLSFLLVSYLITQKINSNRQGVIYKIDFDEKKKTIALYLVNEYTGKDLRKEIPYQNLRLELKKQKIEIKAEQKLKIYNDSELINIFNIKKTPWTAHPRIVEVVDRFKNINN